ncbi:MAG: hypothetical protein FJ102_24205, partial [Deltaproteobacteria bacterium]|nr:hypothetical protein [Deltaproteobacteria bacterium]
MKCNACGAGLPALGRAGLAPQLAAGWFVTLAIVVGPLLFLGEVDVDPLHYLGFLAAYVVISNLFTPSYDASDLGWGGGTIDNPFSHTDD